MENWSPLIRLLPPVPFVIGSGNIGDHPGDFPGRAGYFFGGTDHFQCCTHWSNSRSNCYQRWQDSGHEVDCKVFPSLPEMALKTLDLFSLTDDDCNAQILLFENSLIRPPHSPNPDSHHLWLEELLPLSPLPRPVPAWIPPILCRPQLVRVVLLPRYAHKKKPISSVLSSRNNIVYRLLTGAKGQTNWLLYFIYFLINSSKMEMGKKLCFQSPWVLNFLIKFQ
jgi:hypothetical protein